MSGAPPLVALFGDARWTESLAHFQRSPAKFLNVHQLSAEAFVHGILQVLFSTDLNVNRRVLLLHLLVEHTEYLLHDAARLEHTITSLQANFLRASQSATYFRSQLLVALTGLIILGSFHAVDDQFFCRFLDSLLDLAQQTNATNNVALRLCACECLRELEASLPGLLGTKIGHLCALAMEERTYAVQGYAALLAEALRNVAHLFASGDAGRASGTDRSAASPVPEKIELGTLMSTEQPFKPFFLGSQFSEEAYAVHLRVEGATDYSFPADLPTEDLKRAISTLVELQGRLTSACTARVFLQLIECTLMANINPQVFRQIFLRSLTTFDLPLIQLNLLLKTNFKDGLAETTEGARLVRRLALTVNHPSLPENHRQLCLSWLVDPSILQDPSLKLLSLYPSQLESRAMRLSKICGLGEYLKTTASAGDPHVVSTTLNALDCMNDFASYAPAETPVLYMFTAVYVFFVKGGAATRQELEAFITKLAGQRPQYSHNIVDLVTRIAAKLPASTTPVAVLGRLCEAIVAKPTPEILGSLSNDLMVLGKAARQREIDPVPALGKLQHTLRNSDICGAGNWDTGNAILSVCKAYMTTHPVRLILGPLGDLLCLLWSSYGDIDIQDEARFLYLLLTTTTGKSLTSILQPDAKPQSVTPTAVADGILPTSTFPKAEPTQEVDTVFLALSRRPQQPADLDRAHPATPATASGATNGSPGGAAGTPPGQLLADYMAFVNEAGAAELGTVSLPLRIGFSGGAPEGGGGHDTLIALVLSFSTGADFHPTPEVSIPLLSRAAPTAAEGAAALETADFVLQVRPREPIATRLEVRAEFSTPGGQSFSTSLEPIDLSFQDLFTAVPAPEAHQGDRAGFLRRLHAEVWDWTLEHLQDSERTEDLGAKSVYTFKHHAGYEAMLHSLRAHVVAREAETGTVCLLVFVPPQSHIAIKARPRSSAGDAAGVVEHLTDNWKLLPFLYTLFRDMDVATPAP